MANIIKILLFRGEQSLACLLTAYYEISLDEDMLFSAIDYSQFEWLSHVWAFGKNYLGSRRRNGQIITYEMFFTGIKGMKRIAKQNIPAAKFFTETLSTLTKWFIEGDDDILKALLYHY
jgi:hypothetical protein